MTMRMTAQRNKYPIYALSPISIIGFLEKFKLAHGSTDGLEGAAMWLIIFFMNKIASAVLNARQSADGTWM